MKKILLIIFIYFCFSNLNAEIVKKLKLMEKRVSDETIKIYGQY